MGKQKHKHHSLKSAKTQTSNKSKIKNQTKSVKPMNIMNRITYIIDLGAEIRRKQKGQEERGKRG